jgi:hypothetical protein
VYLLFSDVRNACAVPNIRDQRKSVDRSSAQLYGYV